MVPVAAAVSTLIVEKGEPVTKTPKNTVYSVPTPIAAWCVLSVVLKYGVEPSASLLAGIVSVILPAVVILTWNQPPASTSICSPILGSCSGVNFMNPEKPTLGLLFPVAI